MEKKPRSKKKGPEAEQTEEKDMKRFEEFDVSQEDFEDFDVTQEPEAEAEMSMEALGGLSEKEDEFKSVSQARDELEKQLLLDPGEAAFAAAEEGPSGFGNIVGVGIGEKEVDGVPTGQLAVKVFVKEKLDSEDITSEALVPESVGGVTTDVDTTGEVSSQFFTARLRPAPCGVSIGNCTRVMAGTLGCLVTRANQLFILSNNHVMALVNTSPLGAGIPQPGRLDGGVCPADIIARLTQFIPIVFAAGACNVVDGAIARTSPQLVDRRVLRPGGVRQRLVAPIVAPALNRLVQKSGRTTQYRRGIIDAINVTVNVSYAPLGGVARFCNQFRVRGIAGIFSDRGDSGSLVTTFPQNQPVGLLFAGNASTNTTFCNDIRRVLAAFGVSIVF
jgi:hypothetical protein